MIGRNSKNEIHVVDENVSRFHAQIDYEGGIYYIKDCGSSSGTFIRISEKTELKNVSYHLFRIISSKWAPISFSSTSATWKTSFSEWLRDPTQENNLLPNYPKEKPTLVAKAQMISVSQKISISAICTQLCFRLKVSGTLRIWGQQTGKYFEK